MTDTNTAEREAFKAAHQHLDLVERPDAWGRPAFRASHVEASWRGWQDRASLAASAGSEPVAWRYVDARGNFRYVGYKPSRDMAAEYPMLKPIRLYTHPSPTEGMAGWRPIAEAPKTGRTLLLGYFNSAGKWRTTRGQWMSQDYIDEYAEDPDCMSPGWCETTVEDDEGKCWPIEPTHFMPLPAPPLASEAKEL